MSDPFKERETQLKITTRQGMFHIFTVEQEAAMRFLYEWIEGSTSPLVHSGGIVTLRGDEIFSVNIHGTSLDDAKSQLEDFQKMVMSRKATF